MTFSPNQSADSSDDITRRELYARVWQTPMTKLARQCGVSEIRLKAICDKYEIPTPSQGYWTKVAFGKPVDQVELPQSDLWDDSAILSELSIAPEGAVRSEAAKAQIEEVSTPPSTRKKRTKYHPVVAKTAGYLKTIAADRHGFVCCEQTDMIYVSVSKKSFDRAFNILHSVADACEQSGYKFEAKRGGIQIVIGNSCSKSKIP